MYRFSSPDGTAIIRLADGALIPAHPGNRDYDEYAVWASAGGLTAPYVPPLPTVPSSVTPYQARMALLGAGLLAAVDALMADAGTDQAARIAWEYATAIERDSPFVVALAPALGLTEEQIDGLFIAAAAI